MILFHTGLFCLVGFIMNDEFYMQRAIELAKRGEGFVSPNPLVGAVIVKDGKIIGEGWHERCGELHAERNALKNCKEPTQGSTIYVTLEPCCHYGRTPPCTKAIIEAKISRVVIGSRDPNPLVSGKGAEILRKAGIEVIEDFMRDECDKLNPIFFRYITTKLPYVSLKYAMTADGKIATYSGKSKWITNEFSRNDVHRLRKKHRAIMVGIGTVLTDNPMLNCRIENGRNPIRIVCDSKLRIPLDCNICKTANEISTLVVSAIENPEKQSELEKMGVKTLILPDKNGKVDLKKLMQYLGEKSIDSVLIEGGGTLAYSALQSKIVSHIYSYIAPKIFGGENAKTPVESVGVETPDDCFKLKRTNVRELGSDILIEYDVLEVQ
jgi:diaminohydroxyphosphoribosylaminopyrimidine deaminase/5-amino-6-(5-phosphoribosylamino)uracil reductase|nr:MAG TPA: riboflavin biosynthesis protein RibD [Caudoviricetes sp.]